MKKLILPLLFIISLVPLGLLSEHPAWAEWDTHYYQEVLGFIPSGIKNAFSMPTVLPDYAAQGVHDVVAYYLSALIGVAIIFGFFYLLGRKRAR